MPAAGLVTRTRHQGPRHRRCALHLRRRARHRPRRRSRCRSRSATRSPGWRSPAPRPPAPCSFSTTASAAAAIGLLSGAIGRVRPSRCSRRSTTSRAPFSPSPTLREPRDANAAVAVPELIDANCSVIAMADIGNLTAGRRGGGRASGCESGGVLVRFAGPRLAAATDALIPVTLRHGDRMLGGSLTWQTPQPLASFSDKSPFAGLKVPDDVTVTRQVLAEPDGALAEPHLGGACRRHAAGHRRAARQGLADPLPRHRRHELVEPAALRHLRRNAQADRRLLVRCRRRRRRPPTHRQPVAPYRLLDGYGHFVTPGAEAQPLSGDVAAVAPGIQHPPGLYGTEEGFRALNLLDDKADAARPRSRQRHRRRACGPIRPTRPTELAPWLLAVALAPAGARCARRALAERRLPPPPPRRDRRAAAGRDRRRRARLAAAGTCRRGQRPVRHGGGRARPISPMSSPAIPNVDEVSKAGLAGLSQVLADRTALEPGDPMGVDPERDELAFFPLIYWPIDPATPMPSPATMARDRRLYAPGRLGAVRHPRPARTLDHVRQLHRHAGRRASPRDARRASTSRRWSRCRPTMC